MSVADKYKYADKDFQLEFYTAGQQPAFGSASTIGEAIAFIKKLPDGSRFYIVGRFNFYVIGQGEYRKEGDELIIVQESGSLQGMFVPTPLFFAS
jgi:hypothetical protein